MKRAIPAERVYAPVTLEGMPLFHLWLIPRPTDAEERDRRYITAEHSCSEVEARGVVAKLRAGPASPPSAAARPPVSISTKWRRGVRPVLLVLGGFAGTGKTTISRRLAADLGIPRLGSDDLRRTIDESRGIENTAANAGWIAYDVLFALAEEFLQSGISTVVDVTLGWAFQWQWLEGIRGRLPGIHVLPIVLRCPRDVSLERIQRRHLADPVRYAPPALFTTDPKILAIQQFLDRLDRPDAVFVDAAGPLDEVYEAVRQAVAET